LNLRPLGYEPKIWAILRIFESSQSSGADALNPPYYKGYKPVRPVGWSRLEWAWTGARLTDI